MKIHCAFLLCCLFAAASPPTGFGEGIGFRSFTTSDGRSLSATIKDYNPHSKKIQLKREDGKLIWVLPTVFNEPDREYIRQWIAVDQFMSPAKFKITGDSTKKETSRYQTYGGQKFKIEDKTEIEYEITLENKTGVPLKDLKIEYRGFIFNKGYEDREDSNRIGGGKLIIAEIPAGAKVVQKLRPITLLTLFSRYDTSKKAHSEKMEGFWIRVFGPEINGKPAIREWCHPSDTRENFAWEDKTTPPSTRLWDAHEYSDKELVLLREAAELSNNKNYEKALEVYHKCYEIAQAPDAAAGIGYVYLERLNPPNIPLGLEWMEKAATGNSYNACEHLAFFYLFRGHQNRDPEKAIKYGLQAVAIDPEAVKGHLRLADAYAHAGQFDKAIEHAEIALDLSDNAPTKSGLKKSLKAFQNKKTR